MRLGIIILAHRDPAQLTRLVASLSHPQVRIYLHLDKRAELASFTHELSAARTEDVSLLPRRTTRWGGIELVDASIDGLSRASADRCDYAVLLSGQDFPLRSMNNIVEFFAAAPTRSYMSYWELPTTRWRLDGRDRTDFYTYTLRGRRETCFPWGEDVAFLNWKGRVLNNLLRVPTAWRPSRTFPSYVRPFGGWQWWNLSGPAMQYVLTFLDRHPDYRAYHEHTLCADELFFHSILLGTDFTERYDIVNEDLRFMVWDEGGSHPRVVTEDDLEPMLASSNLFARKFDTSIDSKVLAGIAEAR